MKTLENKKIAIVNPFAESHGGGIETYVNSEKLALEILGAKVDVVRRQDMGKLHFAYSLYRTLNKIRPEIVHAHAAWYALLGCVGLKEMIASKLIFTFHTWDVEKEWNPLKLRVFRYLLSKCDAITFVCEVQRQTISRVMDIKTDTFVTYPGIMSKGIEEVAHEGVVVSHLGRFEWRKKVEGICLLIDAFVDVNNAKLVIAGDGHLRGDVERYAKNSPSNDRISFVGRVNPWKLLSRSDIYAHITYQDWMPLAVIEAMHAGKPIIGSNIGGIPEALGNSGIVVNNERREIGAALKNLIADKDLRERIGASLRLRAKTEYSTEAFARRLAEVFS